LLGEMLWLCIAAGRCCSKLMSVLMEGSSFFCEWLWRDLLDFGTGSKLHARRRVL